MVTCVPGHSDLHRFGEHMRGVVADELQRARIVAGEELDLGVVLDRIGQVGELAVERHRHRALGKRRRNALGDVEAGGVVRIIPTGAVGKGQRDILLFGGSPARRIELSTEPLSDMIQLLLLTPAYECR